MATDTKASARWPSRDWWRDRFLTIDVRTLGLARIYLASLLLFDLGKRSLEMSVWYSETGLLPNAMLQDHPMRPWGYTFFSYVTSDTGVTIAFILIAAVYIGFLVGIFTRLFHVLSFICLVSLQIRVDLLANGGDFVLCNLVLWTSFLPMGAAFSIDARRRSAAGKAVRSPVVSPAVLVIMLQLSVIYYFNAVHKNGVTWQDGSAVYWLAHQERVVTAIGLWMREQLPLWVFQGMTYFALVLEFALPFLILSPWGRPWTRRAAFVGIWVLHLGIAAVANLGHFSFVMIGYSFLLVSTEDWEWLQRKLAEKRGNDDRWTRRLTLQTDGTLSAPTRSPWRWLEMGVLGFLVVVATSQVLVENPAIPKLLKHDQPKWIRATVQTLRLNQGWRMFAPDAPRFDMWLVFDATTVDGRRVDPFNELASRYADPELRTIPPRLGHNYYWCDYTVRIRAFRKYFPELEDWIFRYHERTGNENDRIVSFTAYEVSQIPPAPFESEPKDLKVTPFMQKSRPGS